MLQEGHGEVAQEHVLVQATPAAALEVVQTQLDTSIYRPTRGAGPRRRAR
jgi:hypothetical protein